MHHFPFRSAVLAAALACAPLAFAASPPPAGSTTGMSQPAKHHGGYHMHMFDKLNLSDSQRTSVQQLFQQSFEQARPEMQALQQKQAAFQNATPGSAAYQSAANDLAQAESNAARDRVLRQAELHTKIYNLLTPEQRTQYATLRAQHETGMKRWRGSRMHGSHMHGSHMHGSHMDGSHMHMQKASGNPPAASSTQ
ncbi:MAG TPA: Spy/CpxP family protein refolding chaperone [Rhodanobacteraceae bacterium]|nr:Spy/CpxP family protein refolding chaperone [Rhodanobacteraceae bacterium]